MTAQFLLSALSTVMILAFTGCTVSSKTPATDSYGSQPSLPEPKSRLFPVVNIALQRLA